MNGNYGKDYISAKCGFCSTLLTDYTYRCFLKHLKRCTASLDQGFPNSKLICGSCEFQVENSGEYQLRIFHHHLITRHTRANLNIDRIETDRIARVPASFTAPVVQRPASSLDESQTLSSDDDQRSNNGDPEELQDNNRTDQVQRNGTPMFPMDNTFRFVLQVHGNSSLTKGAGQDVVDHSIDLIQRLNQPILKELDKFDQGLSSTDRIREILATNANSMDSLSTLHRRMKLFKERGMVPPVCIEVSNRIEAVAINPITTVQRTLPVTYQYIPLLETLAFIFKHPDIESMVDNPILAHDGAMVSFMDSARSKSLSEQGMEIQLALYCDDIEIVNCLGAKSGVHKMTMFYISLLNLPPKYTSQTKHIHLVAVANAQDVRSEGIDVFLAKLIDDVKLLEMGVEINGKMRRGTIAVIIADNLAANALYGIHESFSSDFYCRFCITKKAECQKLCASDEIAALRTQEIQQTSVVNKVYGVTRLAKLDELTYFKTTDSFSPDIMHDLLEGVCRIDMSCILVYYISVLKLFSLEYLNAAIHSFSYGYVDRASKPRSIPKPTKGKIVFKQSAATLWCLMRILPVLIGHLILEDCPVWTFYAVMRELVDTVFAPMVSLALIHRIETLITHHHIKYLELWPEENLTPKMHILLHYGEAMRRNGPLRVLWCMRFEAKHQIAKKVGDLSNNFHNPPLTVANQFQVSNFSAWALGNIHPERTIGPTSRDGSLSWVTYDGVQYRPNCVVHVDNIGDLPLLAVVKSITLEEDKYMLNCAKLISDYYDFQMMAFVVRNSDTRVSIKASDLMTPHVMFVSLTADGISVVIPKYNIC